MCVARDKEPVMGGDAPTQVATPPQDGARFELGRLLVCDNCDQLLQPSWSSGGERKYTFLCGCRRYSIEAQLIERLVRDRVEAESSALVADLGEEGPGAVFRALFVEVRIGAAVEDLTYRWRI